MKITDIRLGMLRVPLKTPFKTALRTVDAVEDIIVIIETDTGHIGYGEAIHRFIRPRLVGRDIADLNHITHSIQGALEKNLSAKAAVEIAIHDLFGQLYGAPLYKLLGGGDPVIRTDITISVDCIYKMIADSIAAVGRGFGSLKIKAGKDLGEDIERVEAIHAAVGGKRMSFHSARIRQRGFQASVALLLALLCSSCASTGAGGPGAASAWSDARQLVVVLTPDWNADHGELHTFARRGGKWQAQATPAPVSIGRTGSAWGIGLHPAQANGPQKREGDGRSPAGVFALGDAFGYAERADTAMVYRPMGAADYCIDVSASPLYNRIVNADQVGAAAVQGSTEPMRRDVHADGDTRYRQGWVILHNPRNVPGAGSCIFAHLWRTPGEPTAGCTAMPGNVMQDLFAWLRPDQAPVFVLLPQAEYQRLHAAWNLPAVSAAR